MARFVFRLTRLLQMQSIPSLKSWLSLSLVLVSFGLASAQPNVHVWEKVELTFHAQNSYANPYTNVDVWVDLKGPEFDKRCYGFPMQIWFRPTPRPRPKVSWAGRIAHARRPKISSSPTLKKNVQTKA